jgi:hypothetical protein
VEGLETTEKERDDWAYVFSAPEDQQMFAARFHRDFGRLAKEVERLKEEVRIANNEVVANSVSVGIWMKRAGAAEAKLAVYEAPVADGEVEECAAKLEAYPYEHAPIAVAFLRRLSREKAEAEAREAKLREALTDIARQKTSSEWTEEEGDGADVVGAYDAIIGIAHAALASSSPTKEKTDV